MLEQETSENTGSGRLKLVFDECDFTRGLVPTLYIVEMS